MAHVAEFQHYSTIVRGTVAQEFRGEMRGQGLRVGVVVSRFNEFITSRLLYGAREALSDHGVREEDITIVWVPGSFELPSTAHRMAISRKWDALVCLGAVIKGETDHYHYVATHAASGIAAASRESGTPVAFGVLTTENMEQAMARSGSNMGNRGYDAAMSAMEMVNLYHHLDQLAQS